MTLDSDGNLDDQSIDEATRLRQLLAERDAKIEQLRASLDDESERRAAAEESLAREYAILRTLIDNIPHRVYAKDTESRFILFNPVVMNVFHVESPEELLGKNDLDLTHVLTQERAEWLYASEQELLKSGQAIINDEQLVVLDGEEYCILTTKVPLYNESDEIVGLVGINRDVTEERRLREALTQAREELEQLVAERTAELEERNQELLSERNLLRALIDNVPGYVFIKNLEGRYVAVNRAFVHYLGCDHFRDVIGKTVFDFFPQEQAQQFHEGDLEPIRTNQKIIIKERKLTDPETGEERWHIGSKMPYHNADGEVVGVVGVVRDITAFKHAEVQRISTVVEQKRIEFLREFVDNVSHDLKTPLAILKTNIYLMEKLPEPEKREAKLQTIKNQVQRLETLVRDVLTVSQLEKAPHFHLEDFNLNELLGEIHANLSFIAEYKHVALTLGFEHQTLMIHADRASLERALENVIENALHYTLAGGTVTVKTFQQGDHSALIEVKDTGIGIGEEDQQRIFEDFYRADKARAGDNGGTGLGLPIARRIVERHGGRIEVISVIDAGSTFQIVLPLRADV